jgi:hypothetical protein
MEESYGLPQFTRCQKKYNRIQRSASEKTPRYPNSNLVQLSEINRKKKAVTWVASMEESYCLPQFTIPSDGCVLKTDSGNGQILCSKYSYSPVTEVI